MDEIKSFDNWLKEQGQPASNFLRRETYEAGQQSAQIEIDAMKEALLFQVQMLDKKQKRIDAAIQYILSNQVEGEDADFTGKVVNLIEVDGLLEVLK